MGTKRISLDETAYELLCDRKREDESFSDVINRLAGEQSWMQVAGIWPNANDELSGFIEEGRQS